MSQLSEEALAIKESFERLGMTAEEIAQDRDLEVESVKACLMSVSARFRRECLGSESEDGSEDGKNFSDEQLRRVNQRIYDIAVGSDNDAIALKAATYIRDDKKGRRDVVNTIRGLNFNVLSFNAMLQKADTVVQQALTTGTGKVTDVQAGPTE